MARHRQSIVGWLGLIAAVSGLLSVSGCRESSPIPRARRSRINAQPAPEHLTQAMEYVEQMDEVDEPSARAQAAYQLNRWLDSQKPDPAWTPDEYVNRLPRHVRERGVLNELTRPRFSNDDLRGIQEAVWMRQLSQWVVQQPLDPLVGTWLERNGEKLGNERAERLGTAYRLFDWIVRNIQLEELLASPDEAVAAPAAGANAAETTRAVPAALQGVPGPGYQAEPLQVLLYGHGDVWQRMRLFTLLARQQGLDVITLAFPGRTIPPRPRPWVSGVLLGEDLYLFDLKLGLPIPSETGEGIATLREVMAKPAMLEQLAVSEKYPYQIASEDLTEVVALLDVLAVNLAQRTALVEQHLIGEHRTVLTVPLSELAGKLGKSPGVSDVYIWSVPFEAEWFRAAMQQIVQEDNQVALRYFQTRSMFQNQTPLARGRVAYLRGDIDSEEEREGAKVLLMQARVPQTQLEDLASDEDVQKHLGMSRDERTSPQQWAMQMEMFKQILTLSKQHASMWLGLCQLETGRPDAAIEWFGTRTLEAFPNGFWTPLARYDLARCYEMQGKLAEAQRLLLEDKSLQEHGNYLRARMLEKRLAAPAAADAPPPNAADAP